MVTPQTTIHGVQELAGVGYSARQRCHQPLDLSSELLVANEPRLGETYKALIMLACAILSSAVFWSR